MDPCGDCGCGNYCDGDGCELGWRAVERAFQRMERMAAEWSAENLRIALRRADLAAMARKAGV
jgi:hypothetical protein